MWRHLLTKFASYKVPPVMVSTHRSVVPLAMFYYMVITKVPGNTFFPTPLKWFCGDESDSSFCGAIYEKAQLSCWEARTAAAVEMSTASIPSRRGRELMQQIRRNLYCWYIAYMQNCSAAPYLSEFNPSLNSSFGVWQCKTFEHSNCQISSVMWYSRFWRTSPILKNYC